MQIALSMDRCLRAKGDASPLRSWKTNFSPVCLLPLYNAGVSSLIFVNTRWGKTIFLVVCFSIAKIQSRARRRVKILKNMSRSFSFNYPSTNHWVSDYWRRDWVLFGFFFCTFPKLLNLISLEKLHIFNTCGLASVFLKVWWFGRLEASWMKGVSPNICHYIMIILWKWWSFCENDDHVVKIIAMTAIHLLRFFWPLWRGTSTSTLQHKWATGN